MIVEDLIIGFVISKLFGSSAAKSPAVVFQAPPGSTPATSTPATTPAGTPAPASPGLPAPPAFPAQQTPPPTAQTQAPPGFKRAIEVWQVRPDIVRQAAPALSGLGVGAEAVTVQMLEAQFPKGWQGMKSATAEEAANAKRLLGQWKDGGVLFLGPATLGARRAYRMTKHPATSTPTTVTTTATPAPPAPSTASFPSTPATATPAAAPPAAAPPAPTVSRTPGGGTVTTLPEVLITADAPAAAAPAAQPVNQITAVRKGEGLANVAKRLGFPANASSARMLQQANVPGPDGWFSSQDLAKGGLKKRNRAGGLQPGDRLFVPPAWSPVDVARL